jgi:phosphate:Na+ symporter
MSGAISSMNNTSFFTSVLPSINNPFLLLLTGIIVTVLLQSSSALTGVLIALSIAGVTIGKGGNSMYFIILGSNIGTCSTALMSTFGANSNGKRAALIHLMFNVLGSIIFFIFLMIYKDFAVDVMERLFTKGSTQIAMFHTLFNVVSTLLLLPLAKYLVKAANKMVKEKDKKYQFKYIDERFLNTPFMAASMLNKEIAELLLKVETAMNVSIDDYLKQEEENREYVSSIRNDVAMANQSLTEYLINLSSSEADYSNEVLFSSYHHVLSDIDRIADLCMSVIRVNERGIKSNICYSSASFKEISAMKEDLLLLIKKVHSAFLKRDKSLLEEIERIEDGIDKKREEYSKNHIDRLNKKECPTESSSLYTSLLNSLERMGDHLTFIARSLVEIAHKN